MNASHESLGRFEQQLLGELRRVVVERASGTPVVGRTRTTTHAPFLRKRSFALAGGLAAAIGLALAAGLPIGGTGGDGGRAYAVTKNPDGTVTVKIDALSDAAGLERKLNEAGVPALVQYLPPGKACAAQGGGDGGLPAPPPRPHSGVVESGTSASGLNEAGAPSTHVEGVGPDGGSMTQSADDPGGAVPEGAVSGGVRMNEDGSVEFTIDAPDLGARTLVIRNQQFAAAQAPQAPPGGAPEGATSVGISFEKGHPRPCKVVDASSPRKQ